MSKSLLIRTVKTAFAAIFQVFRSLDQFIEISTCIKNKCKPLGKI